MSPPATEDVILDAIKMHLPLLSVDITKTALWPRVKPGFASPVEQVILVRQETEMKLLMRMEERLARMEASITTLLPSPATRGKMSKNTAASKNQTELSDNPPKTVPQAKGKKRKSGEFEDDQQPDEKARQPKKPVASAKTVTRKTSLNKKVKAEVTQNTEKTVVMTEDDSDDEPVVHQAPKKPVASAKTVTTKTALNKKTKAEATQKTEKTVVTTEDESDDDEPVVHQARQARQGRKAKPSSLNVIHIIDSEDSEDSDEDYDLKPYRDERTSRGRG
ncbi:hypothetical protein V8E51_003080 [Hyaloscypha variabilis]